MSITTEHPDRQRVEQALATVVDPEIGLAITDLGLVREIAFASDGCRVTLTMTSASCPMGGLIVDEALSAVKRALGTNVDCRVDLQLDPPWTPDAMSERARRLLGG